MQNRSHDTITNLTPLQQLYGTKASSGWLAKMASILDDLEHRGFTHFGAGSPRPDVAAWWITHQAQSQHWSFMRVTSYVAQLAAEKNQQKVL